MANQRSNPRFSRSSRLTNSLHQLALCIAAQRSAPSLHLRSAWCEAICFRAASRFGDVNRLRRRDLTISPEGLKLVFLTWKNDQRHEGHTVFIQRSASVLCFVKLTEDYIKALEGAAVYPQDGFMLPQILEDSNAVLPFTPSTYDDMKRLKFAVLRKMGLDPTSFGMHAAKVGAIYALREAGFDREDIRIRSGWKKGSAMPERYAKKALSKAKEMDTALAL